MVELIEWLEERAGGLDIDAGNGVTDAESLILRRVAAELRAVREAPVAEVHGSMTPEAPWLACKTDNPAAVYALHGQRVRLVPVGEGEFND